MEPTPERGGSCPIRAPQGPRQMNAGGGECTPDLRGAGPGGRKHIQDLPPG
jgi:hypothetical protein